MNAPSTGSRDSSRRRIPRFHAPSPAPTGAAVTPDDGPTGRARRRPSRRLVTAALVAAPLVLAACNQPSYGASRGSTTQGQDIFKLWSAMVTIGIVIGGSVAILILWSVIRYRRRSDEMPKQFHENVPLEIVYTVLPVIIVGFLFTFTVLTENNVDRTVAAGATVTTTGNPVVDITVTAFQWGWRFDYPGLNVGVAGPPTHGPDTHGPQMVVPAGETVQITLVSDDVVHGFYVRDFNFSRYAQPGVTNVFDLNVVHTGTYDGQCTQFCGLYHSDMLFSVRAVTPAGFEQWASNEVATGNTLQAAGSGAGSSASNTPPPNVHQTHSNAAPAVSTKPKAIA